MQQPEPVELLAARLREYRGARYPDLVELTERTDTSVGIGCLGTRFKIEIGAVWDVEDPDAIWVYGSAFGVESREALATLGFLINSDGEVLRQDFALEAMPDRPARGC